MSRTEKLNYLATGGGDGEVNIWEIGNEIKLYKNLVNHEYISFCKFSSSNQMFGTSGSDKILKIWRVDYLQGVKQNKLSFDMMQQIRFSSHVCQINFSSDDLYLVVEVNAAKQGIHLFKRNDEKNKYEEDMEFQRAVDSSVEKIYTLVVPEFSKCNQFLLQGYYSKSIERMTCIYQLDKLKKGGLNKIKGYMPTFSKNGELLATSKNEQVLIYDWDTNNIKDIKLIQTLIGAKGNLLKPIFSKDSNKIIAGDSEGFLAVWDLHSGQISNVIEARNNGLSYQNMVLSDDDLILVIGSQQEKRNNLGIWVKKNNSYEKLLAIAAHKQLGKKIEDIIDSRGEYVNSVSFLTIIKKNENYLITGSTYGFLNQFRIDEFSVDAVSNIGIQTDKINDLMLTGNGNFLYTATEHGNVKIYKQRSEKLKKYDDYQLIHIKEKLVHVCAHPNDKYLALASESQIFFFRQDRTEEFVNYNILKKENTDDKNYRILQIMFSPDGVNFCISYEMNSVVCSNLVNIENVNQTGKVIGQIVCFNVTGDLFAVIENFTLKIYTYKNMTLKSAISNFNGMPTSAVFTKDSKFIIVSDQTGQLCIYNVQTAKIDTQIASFTSVSCCCFVSIRQIKKIDLSSDNIFLAVLFQDYKKDNLLIYKYENNGFREYQKFNLDKNHGEINTFGYQKKMKESKNAAEQSTKSKGNSSNKKESKINSGGKKHAKLKVDNFMPLSFSSDDDK